MRMPKLVSHVGGCFVAATVAIALLQLTGLTAPKVARALPPEPRELPDPPRRPVDPPRRPVFTPRLPPPPPPQNRHCYFGDLHSHTTFSDGSSDIGHAFIDTLNKIRDLRAQGVDPSIDFLAITDHAGSIQESEWATTLAIADAFTLNGGNPNYPGIRFVGIAGFEADAMGTLGFIDPWGGHENLFAVESNVTVYAGDWLAGYWETLWPLERYVVVHNNIVQLNHPFAYSEGDKRHYDFFDFTRPDQGRVFDHTALIEIGGIGGVDRVDLESQYIRALDRGWHVAPTMNSDWNSDMGGRWDRDFRTAVITTAPTLSREEIYSAMRDRRVYATEDKNLVIDFRINDLPMGSILSTADNTLYITIAVSDPDPSDRIDKIELYSNNGVLQTVILYGQGPQYRTSFAWPFLRDPGTNYFFVKIYQADGQRAWTAPIRVYKQ